ncbi:hypothetical protein OGH69_12620 [Flavobacterium sp. MFBS3-15]|uniref:hypothetical protein n=1 Tax=Flavobacterium sp. MFBS3-15 TaxID=2989816 RepID=UPI0022366ACD|nr:hypothetical protein [Flavobacterium sp. MFBS3-15]MCW4469816.1 hypothetical protein [Flavobacterium sp. MFBS3-15]
MLSPTQHGTADWGFVAGLLLVPKVMGVNTKAQKFYNALACNVVAINGATDHDAGFAPLISVKTHQKLDYANIALLYAMFAAKMIRKDKKAVLFHTGLTALATVNVLLTDYDHDSITEGP